MASIQGKDVEALGAEFPTANQEKQLMRQTTQKEEVIVRPNRRTISSGRKMLLALLVSLLVTFGITSTSTPSLGRRMPCHGEIGDAQEVVVDVQESAFSSLLGSASPESISALLQKYLPEKYKLGVWPSAHSALEAVHQEDATLASSIAQMAKRQDNNTTVAITTVESTMQVTSVAPLSKTAVSVATIVVTSVGVGQETTVTVENTPTVPAASTSNEATTTAKITMTADANTPTTQVTTPSVSVSASSGTSKIKASSSASAPASSSASQSVQAVSTTSVTQSAPSSSVSSQTKSVSSASARASVSPPLSTASEVATTKTSTDTTLTTSSKLASSSTAADSDSSLSQSLRKVTSTYTSTLPGGEVSVVTQTSVVNADPAETGSSGTSTRPAGSLQTNKAAVVHQRGPLIEIVVGVVMGGALLL